MPSNETENIYTSQYGTGGGGGGGGTAAEVSYNNSHSGLNAHNVQTAIDVLAAKPHIDVIVTGENLIFND